MSEEKLSDIVGTDVIIDFPTGKMKASTLDSILSLIPFEMGFCDENDIFRWYTNRPDRLFPRRTSAFGKHAADDLHPAAQEPVRQLLNDFRAGVKKEYVMWLPPRGEQKHPTYRKFIAVHDEAGKYLGCFDVTMNLDFLADKFEGKNTPDTMDEFKG